MRKQNCNTKNARAGKITSYNYLRDEAAIKEALKKGPVAVAIDAKNIVNYDSGIFRDVMCTHKVNHAVLLVGYTSDYWIVRNSWGTDWGVDGYIYLEMGNTCAIEDYAY